MTEEMLAAPTPKDRARRPLRRAAVAAAGAATVLVGIALIPLPGPGTMVVVGGLTVLRKEFPSAGRVADRIKRAAGAVVSAVRQHHDPSEPSPDRTVAPRGE
ncbi:MAG TPA: PGPGW domain-containing protein [Acidimicrobiia bacterium]